METREGNGPVKLSLVGGSMTSAVEEVGLYGREYFTPIRFL